jgi:hypothetical protein
MKLLILAVVLVNLCVANAQWWGWGGYGGYGWGGWGYPYFGYGFYGKRAVPAAAVPPVVEGIQCAYLPETHMFSCKRGGKTVECGAVGNFSTFGYHLFGIGKLGGDHFFLYPRNFDNTTYLPYQFGTGTGEFVLYHGDNFVHYGVRVTDSKCWTGLVGFFSTFTNFHTVTVGGTEVGLIGEVLVHDVTVTKRWLYGFGWGGWGYPFGYGYGWGYPYYGFY